MTLDASKILEATNSPVSKLFELLQLGFSPIFDRRSSSWLIDIPNCFESIDIGDRRKDGAVI